MPLTAPGRLTPWCEATLPPVSTSQRTPLAHDLEGAQPDPAVREEDRIAGLDGVGQPVEGDGQPTLVAQALVGRQLDLAAPVHA